MKRKLLLLFLFLYFVYGIILVSGSRTGLPDHMGETHLFPYLADQPVGEDGYYMLTVAWNIAEGRGIVYTYDIQTTGIQPLVTFIFSGVAWAVQVLGGNKWIFIRAIMFLGVILLPIFGHIIGIFAREITDNEGIKEQAYLFSFVITLFNIELFRWFTYGLETGVYLILMAVTILKFTEISKETNIKKSAGLGVLVGLTCLARIDFIVIFLLVLLIAILFDKTSILYYFVVAVTAFLITFPWFFYVYSVTGNWIPSSGGAQAGFLSSDIIGFGGRFLTGILALLSYSIPWIIPYERFSLFLISFLLVILLVFWMLRPKDILVELAASLKQKPYWSVWFLAIPILVLIYPIFFWAWHFYARYYAPITIPLYAIGAILIVQKLRAAKQFISPIIFGSLPIAFFLWCVIIFHTGMLRYTYPVAASFIQKNFSTQKVGSFQSGVTGFFNPNVINLDGKVNHEALVYTKRHALHQYIDQEHIDVLVDWPIYFEKFLEKNWLTENWERCPQEIPETIAICLIRVEN